MIYKSSFILVLVIGVTGLCTSVNGNKDTAYTPAEQAALANFREAVKDMLYQDYQKEDVYLVRWLRARNLDVPMAKEMLQKSLDWRKKNNIDKILSEKEMQELRKPLPSSFNAVDRELRPVFQAPFGVWNLRKFMVGGKGDLVNRYIIWNFEAIVKKVRDDAKAGKDVSRWNFLVDMSNYNLRQHACLACVPFYINLVNYYEAHYPLTAEHIIIFNTPRIFEAILQLIRPLMSEPTRKAFQVFGPNKEEWQPVLLKFIAPEELSTQFGGTKHESRFNY